MVQVTAVDGAAIGARRAGEAGPALVFVHGVGSTAAIWDRQLDALGCDFRCAAIELRGNGALPDPDPKTITRETFASDVVAVADALGFERFTLVGCSLGGVIAFEVWKQAASRFEAMTIVGSFAVYPNARQYAEGIVQTVRAAGTMQAFAQQRAAKLGLPAQRLAETIEQMACKSVACYEASTQATWTGDYRDVLKTIDVPTLVLCGEHDAVAPLALSQEIARGIAGSRLAIVPGAGHVANADAPERFNALLREFLIDSRVA